MKKNAGSIMVGKSGFFGVLKYGMALATLGLVGLIVVMMAGDVNAQSFNIEDNLVINPLYRQYLNDVANGRRSEWDLIPNKYIAKYRESGYGGDFSLPSSYNLVSEGYGTPIKNQGADGICWSYAWITTMESYMLKTQNKVVDFSAKQLDYLLASGTDYYNYINNQVDSRYVHELGKGYNFAYASFALSSSSMPAGEKKFFNLMQANDSGLDQYNSFQEYQDRKTIELLFKDDDVAAYTVPMSNEMITMNESDYVVTEYTEYSVTADEIDVVKKAVYDNGAVYIGTIAPGVSNCYDAATNTIVDRGASICNSNGKNGHAMAIVGWDDEHTYTDPATGTIKKGAFILQNSWGSNNLLSDYGITYETAVAQGLIDPTGLTEQQINNIKQNIANYKAPEYTYWAYEFYDGYDSNISFAEVDGMVSNDYKNIYDLTDEKGGFGSTSGDLENEIIYTYEVEGSNAEKIDGIAVSTHDSPFPKDFNYKIYVDDGDGYVEFGSVVISAGILSAQKLVSASKDVIVSGDFKVKIVVTVDNNVAVSGLSSYRSYITTTVYTSDTPEVPDEPDGPDGPDKPDDGGETKPEDGDKESEEDIKVPDTGLFSNILGGALRVIPMLMVVVGFGYVGYRTYRDRKEIFHRVKFDKK